MTLLAGSNGEKILRKLPGEHNHACDEFLEREIILNSAKRKAIEDIVEKPAKMVHQEIQIVPAKIRQTLMPIILKLVRKNICAGRRIKYPPLPKSIMNVHNVLGRMDIKCADGQNFLFATDENLRFLCKMKRIYVDGTFSHSTKHFINILRVGVRK